MLEGGGKGCCRPKAKAKDQWLKFARFGFVFGEGEDFVTLMQGSMYAGILQRNNSNVV